MLSAPPVCDFGWPAPAFKLPATDGSVLSYADIAGPNGTLVMFICNHCPYVLRILDKLISDGKALSEIGIGVVAISANDADDYPQDSFENMKRMADKYGFPFPYLYDESQSVARAYDAACTPDFFGFDSNGGLQYRGRIDELLEAMTAIADTGNGPVEQIASMGCSIKWKA